VNRLILRHGYMITAVIALIFAWVIYRRISTGSGIRTLAITALIVWVCGTSAFVVLWPRMVVTGFKRAALGPGGFGGHPIPVNTLYAEPGTASASASNASLMGTGTDHLIYLGGWIDLSAGPQVLRVPDTAGRYYNVQLTEPSGGTNFAYIGKRTTGTAAGAYALTGPGWTGTLPDGVAQVPSPSHGVLAIGRVYLAGDHDQPAAYALAEQFRLTPLSSHGTI